MKQVKYGRRPIQTKEMRGAKYDGEAYGIPASDREISRQTGLPPSSVHEAIKRLQGFKYDQSTRKWTKGSSPAFITVLNNSPTAGRLIQLNYRVLAKAYYKITKDPVAKAEYGGADPFAHPKWGDSQTRQNATQIKTILNQRLLKVTGDPLAARALHQLLYQYARQGQPIRYGWWHTTVKWLGKQLGVSEDAANIALRTLEKKQLIFRKTWRGRIQNLNPRTQHTLLAPNMKKLKDGLRINPSNEKLR